MNTETTPQFAVLNLVKRDKPAVVPQPVYFQNAQGDLCDTSTSTPFQMGVEAAKSTLEALAADEHAPI